MVSTLPASELQYSPDGKKSTLSRWKVIWKSI
jgi:hypothetical protein